MRTTAAQHRRALSVVLLGLALTVAFVVLRYAPGASADGHGCPTSNPNCVGVTTSTPGDPGGPGGPGGPGHSGGGGDTEPPVCKTFTGYARTLCDDGFFVRNAEVCLEAYYQGQQANLSPDDLNKLLAATGCPPATGGAQPVFPTPAELAKKAADSFLLLDPTTGRYPGAKLPDGRPYTVVKAHTWFWTSPATWKSFTATATAGPNWATVTAAPTALTFTPGDGSPSVSCAGPGVAWTPGYGPWAASPAGCDYRYQHATVHGMVTATYTITWMLTWTGSQNTAGTLDDRTTTSQASFVVAEIQILTD